MKKYVNGKIVDMTSEEIVEFETAKKEFEERQKNIPPTAEERLEAVEAAFLELAEVLFNG